MLQGSRLIRNHQINWKRLYPLGAGADTAIGGAAGTFSLDANTTITLNGGIDATAGAGVADIAGAGSSVSFDDAVILGATILIDTQGNTDGNTTFNNRVDASVASTQGLTVSGGTVLFGVQ